MHRSRLITFCLAASVAAVVTMFAVRATMIRNAAANKSGIVRAVPKVPSGPHFRLAQIHDSPVEKVRVIAIEKHPFDSDHPSLAPSFCELKVDHASNSAIMYIQGQPVIPDSDLLVFMADYEAPPRRVVIDRSAFDKIYPLHDDKDLWDLCVEAIKSDNSATGIDPAG